jgi:hypothetical protein
MAEKTLYQDGDNKQLRDAIFKATPLAVTQTKSIANKFKGKTDLDTCKNIFNYLLTSVSYKEDGMHQKIKVPSALMREKQADCKSYALFTAGILQNLGIGWKYCLTSYSNDPTPQHIYVVTDSGIIIDAVWKIFNEEKKPTYKFYHKPDLTDMKISYIAGIGARHSNSNRRTTRMGNAPLTNYPTSNIGSTTLLGAMNCRPTQVLPNTTLVGIGRTGWEWLKAATGREATAGEIIEYGLKNGSLLPARFIVEQFIQNNGGGIANFLYNAWIRNEAYYLPNQKKYQAELLAGEKEIQAKGTIKSWQVPADAQKRYQDAYNKFSTENPNATFTKKLIDFYTPEQVKAREQHMEAQKSPIAYINKLTAELKANLEKKYPEKTRMILPATPASQKAFRDLELAWFWKLGGSPDDLNNAIKEGNTKSPRGRDANYLINKMFNGEVKAKDLGLIIRGFVSAFGGDKFGLGDDGTYVIGIHGNKKQGIGEPLTAAVISAKITLYTPTILVALGALGAVMKSMKDAGLIGDKKTEETSADGTKSDYILAIEDGWSDIKPESVESESKTVKKLDGTEVVVYREKIKEDGLSDDNTTTYIVAGVAALGLLYFITKK